MNIRHVLILSILVPWLCMCNDGPERKREELKKQYFNLKLNTRHKVDLPLFDQIWADRQLRYLLTPDDVRNSIDVELKRLNGSFKWCEIALSTKEFKAYFPVKLCILSSSCSKPTRLNLCQLGLASATILDIQQGFDGMTEYAELVNLQKHQDRILKSCLDQLIAGRSICEIEPPAY